MECKRIKCKNFTEKEKTYLIELVSKYRSYLENKATNASTTIAKNKAWDALTIEFNATMKSEKRNTNQLKNLYKNLKHLTRKEHRMKYLEVESDLEKLQNEGAPNKKELNKTEGHTIEPQLINTNFQILALAGKQITPLQNPYDDSTICQDNRATILSPNLTKEEVEVTPALKRTTKSTSSLSLTLDSPTERVLRTNTPGPSSVRYHNQLGRRKKKIITTENIRKKYFFKKLEIVQFQLKSLILQHNLEMKIKKEQLKYYKAKNIVKSEI